MTESLLTLPLTSVCALLQPMINTLCDPCKIWQIMSLLCKKNPSVMAPCLCLRENKLLTMAYRSLNQNYLWGLLEMHILGPHLRANKSESLGEDQKSMF